MESVDKYIPSHPLLKQKVASIVFWRRTEDEKNPAVFLPNNICGFGFTLSGSLLVKNDEEFQEMPAFGTRNTLQKPSEILTKGDFLNISVRLVIPNGLSLFTKIPMHLVYEKEAFSLTDIFNENEINSLVEKLYEAKTDSQKVVVLESFIVDKIINPMPEIFIGIITSIHLSKGHITVSQLSKQFYVSERSINRYFNKYVGINPNVYINLIRFRAVIDLQNTNSNILHHALDVGYYDQSHFIKHFKEFSTVTPSQFFSLNSDNSLSDFYNI